MTLPDYKIITQSNGINFFIHFLFDVCVCERANPITTYPCMRYRGGWENTQNGESRKKCLNAPPRGVDVQSGRLRQNCWQFWRMFRWCCKRGEMLKNWNFFWLFFGTIAWLRLALYLYIDIALTFFFTSLKLSEDLFHFPGEETNTFYFIIYTL